MKLIEKIEINYFRSSYKVVIDSCQLLNIFSGRNDVGKSNVLKALNLFFNGKSDWDTDFDFYENFSTKRLENVRSESVKGKQYISIKVHFCRPDSYKRSLPKTFWQERKWSRDGNGLGFVPKDNLEVLNRNNKLPGTLSAAQSSLTKFLNKIHFEYVPAIKGRDYFQHLLINLQKELLTNSISTNQHLNDTASNLASDISEQILDLKNEFVESAGLQTLIMPPTNISALFQAFSVSTESEYGEIPMKYRGDGLQARYIASALNFFSSKNPKWFIWGFEEPEIALEYMHSYTLAKSFKDEYSKNAQIFLTTHSPAFISLDGESVARYRVTQKDSESKVFNLKKAGIHYEELKHELGIIELQKEVHEKYLEQMELNNKLEEEIEKLNSDILENQKPLVLTEGKTDKLIFFNAYEKLYEIPPPFIIRECDNLQQGGGSGGAGNLQKMIETIHPADERKVIGVFDNDEAGIKAFNSLDKNFISCQENARIKRHKNGYAVALLLPIPEFRDASTKDISTEFMFEDEYLNYQDENGEGLQYEHTPPKLISQNKVLELNDEVWTQVLAALDDSALTKKITSGKEVFAEKLVPTFTKDAFDAFDELFIEIEQELGIEQ